MRLTNSIIPTPSIAVVLLAGGALTGCDQSPPGPNTSAGGGAAPAAGPAWFEEVAQERGLSWAHQSGSLRAPPGSMPGNRFFRNRGDGTFEFEAAWAALQEASKVNPPNPKVRQAAARLRSFQQPAPTQR